MAWNLWMTIRAGEPAKVDAAGNPPRLQPAE
jgi:hypothetical protein